MKFNLKKYFTHENFIALVAIVFMVLTGRNAALLKRQIELENRPFVSIEDVWWRPDTVWIWCGFNRTNYGTRPAEEIEFRNFRAVVFEMRSDLIEQKVKQRTPPERMQYLQEYMLDERNKIILNLMEVIATFFKERPDARYAEVDAFLRGLTPESPELRKNGIFIHEGQLLFQCFEVNHDMDEYRRRQKTTVFPEQPHSEKLDQQMGEGGLRDVLQGDKLLVLYWAFRYHDIQKDNEYSTYYLGYSDRNFGQLLNDGRRFSVQEFQSWASERPLKSFIERLRGIFGAMSNSCCCF